MSGATLLEVEDPEPRVEDPDRLVVVDDEPGEVAVEAGVEVGEGLGPRRCTGGCDGPAVKPDWLFPWEQPARATAIVAVSVQSPR